MITAINRCSASILTLLNTTLTALQNGRPSPDGFTTLLHLANQQINTLPFHAVGAEWLRLYVDASIGLVLSEISLHRVRGGLEAAEWRKWIRMLDMAIIVAGAIGPGREDVIHALIRLVQRDFAAEEVERYQRLAERDLAINTEQGKVRQGTPTIHYAPQHIPSPSTPPSATQYTTTSHLKPFILRGFAKPDDTPARKAWQSPAYLLHAAGPGRYVPVEVGKSYTDQGWGQRIIRFETFLRGIGYDLSEVFPGSSADDVLTEEEDEIPEGQPLYLAQHALLDQFPALRRDIGALPDYVYSAPERYDGEEYAPPGNEEGLVMNVWVGSGASSVRDGEMDSKQPRGGPVISPAHTVRPALHRLSYNQLTSPCEGPILQLLPPNPRHQARLARSAACGGFNVRLPGTRRFGRRRHVGVRRRHKYG